MLKRIAFQGEHGSFAEEAANEFFTGDSEIVACPQLADLRRAVETETADFAVLPIENSLVGAVEVTNNFLAETNWREVGTLFLPIRLFLIAAPNAIFEELREVESHPAALAQCRRFFLTYSHLRQIETENTAASAKRVVESRESARAAIAGRRAAEIFGGAILLEDLQDKQENYTKFLLLKK